ncbi:MAG: beta strand repeat-containing protein [Pyrinomonadaceae bacterium]
MKHRTPILSRDNLRAYVAAIIIYVMLAGQVAPLVAAAAPKAPAAPPAPAPTTPLRAAPMPAPVPFFVPGITATKVDSWDDSVIPNGKAEPGQTVTYTVTITNTGDTDATGVTFTDSMDANTTLVATSVQTQPIAVPDAYSVLGNVRIQVTDPTQGLLANDRDPDTGNNTNLTASGPATTTQGGQITINSNGTFTYNPPPGFEGSNASGDKVTYTIRDTGPDAIAGNADDKTDTAVATFNVSGMIWFVNSAVSNGDGRLTSPFNCLRGPGCFDTTTAAPGAADDPNDNVFLYSGGYVGGLTLLSGQKLIGQGASTTLEGIAGVTVPANSDALPALSNNPSLVTITTAVAATNGVNLPATGAVTLRGFTGGNATGFDIASGATFGTLNASEVVLNGTGGTLNLNTGALNATFGGVSSSSSGAQGLSLQSVSGSLTTGGTTISGSTTQGVLVTGSTANIDFGNTSVGTASAGTGGTNGISLQNNSAGTRTFGTVSIQNNSGANSAFLIGGGGNSGGSVTAAATTISTAPANGNDIDIQNLAAGATVSFGATTVNKTSAGALVNMASDAGPITFNSLTGSNSAGNGIIGTNNTGALTVTNGTGSISSTGGSALSLNNSSGNQAINLNFTTLTTSAGTANSLLLKNVGGTGLSLPNAVTFDMAAGSAEVIKIQNSTAGTIRVGTNGTTNNAVALNNRRNTGVLIDNASNTIQFGTTTVNNPQNAGGYGIRVANSSAAVTFPSATIGGANITSAQADAGDGTGSTDGDGDAIFLTTNSGSFTLNGGTLSSPGNDAIDARASNNLTVSGVTITNPGQDVTGATGGGAGGHGIALTDMTGTTSITGGTSISGVNVANRDGIHNYSRTSTAHTLSVSGVTIQNSTGNAGILAYAQQTGNLTFTVGGPTNNAATNCTFTNISGSAIIMNADNTATNTATVQRSTFQTAPTNGKTNIVAGHNKAGHATFNILNNTFTNVMKTASTGEGVISLVGGTDTNTTTGNLLAINVTGNTLTGVGGGGSTCGGGATFCAGSLYAIFIFFDGATALSGNVLVDSNTITAAQQGGVKIDMANTGTGATAVNAKITNNSFGTAASAIGQGGTSVTVQSGIVVERRRNNPPNGNVLISGNTVRNGTGTSGNTLNAPGIFARTKGNGNMSVTVTGNNVDTNLTGGVAEMRFDTNANDVGDIVAPVQCDDVSGNTLPAGAAAVIDFNETNGTHNVEQASAAAVSSANSSATVTADAGVSFNVACATPPAAPVGFTSEFVQEAPAVVQEAPAVLLDSPDAAPAADSNSKSAFDGGVTSRPFVSPRATSAPKAVRAEAKRDGGRNFHYAAADTSAPLNPAPEPLAQRRKVAAPVLTDAPGGPNGPGGTVSVNIGTLAPADSVTITFQVVVDNPYGGGPNISNQGTVSGSNFSDVFTDDPDVAGAANPTLTPINSTDIRINDASVAEPAAGTAQMLFTLSLTQPAGGGGLSVSYATANGGGTPATGGASCDGTVDYVTASGTATVPAGSQVTTIPVTICADNVGGESSETLLLNISSPSSGTIVDNQATGTITQGTTAGTFIISELRTSGPGGAGDDFVEFYNNSNSPLTVAASDASAGYGLYKMGATCNDTPVLIATIPNGTVIPARGHYLAVGSAYSLANYGGTGAAAGNVTLTSDIGNDQNVAVFSTSNFALISSANRLDAVGGDSNAGAVCDLLREGNNLPAVSGNTAEHAYFRSMNQAAGGNPKDTNDNAADFVFADTQGTFISGVTQRLGAPGPENLASPIRRDNAGVNVLFLDGTKTTSAAPNRDRDFTSGTNKAFGSLFVRRRVQNNTGATVTRLRFRIVEVTTFPSPGGGVADLRALTSSSVVISGITDPATCAATGTPTTVPCQVTAQATTLEQPPSQPNGGGYNSTLSVTLPGPGLANNASIDVNFLLGIQQTGTFRFLIIVEALP